MAKKNQSPSRSGHGCWSKLAFFPHTGIISDHDSEVNQQQHKSVFLLNWSGYIQFALWNLHSRKKAWMWFDQWGNQENKRISVFTGSKYRNSPTSGLSGFFTCKGQVFSLMLTEFAWCIVTLVYPHGWRCYLWAGIRDSAVWGCPSSGLTWSLSSIVSPSSHWRRLRASSTLNDRDSLALVA